MIIPKGILIHNTQLNHGHLLRELALQTLKKSSSKNIIWELLFHRSGSFSVILTDSIYSFLEVIKNSLHFKTLAMNNLYLSNEMNKKMVMPYFSKFYDVMWRRLKHENNFGLFPLKCFVQIVNMPEEGYAKQENKFVLLLKSLSHVRFVRGINLTFPLFFK